MEHVTFHVTTETFGSSLLFLRLSAFNYHDNEQSEDIVDQAAK